jgi:hypothetical protein
MSFLYHYGSEDSPFSVVIDDDDRVAYAYLLKDGKICGDVWLYNCESPPKKPEWSDPSKAPFANPQEFAAENSLRITDIGLINLRWKKNKESLERAEICLADELLAILAPGAKPGWCRNARKDSPLAKALPNA